MNLEDYIEKCTVRRTYDEFCASGLKPLRERESDDYFVYGTFDSDRTSALKDNMKGYRAKKYVCFAPKGIPYDRAYQFDSPPDSLINIEQNDMYVTDEMVNRFFKEFQVGDEESELSITVDLNSFDREFLLLLSTMLFKSKRALKIRFLYFSSGDPKPSDSKPDGSDPYDLKKWMELDHNEPEILLVTPGVPVFDSTALVVVSGYEVGAVKRLVDKFRPSKLLLGRNKLGVNPKAHEMNLITHEESLDLLGRYKNSPDDNIVEFDCDVRNPLKCCRDLEAVIGKNCAPGTHIKLAATNTRLSLIGVTLLAAREDQTHNVQIVYAKPKDFDDKTFSKGAYEFYEYTFERRQLSLSF